MTTLRNKRDYRLDIMRIFACFSVVLIHAYEPLYINNKLSYQMLFLYSLVGFANSIFFSLTGAFWYKDYPEKKNYLDVIKKFMLSIFLPTLLCSIFFALIDPILFGYEGSILKLFNIPDIKMIIKGLLTHNFNAISGASLPYWYIFTFMGLLLFYPIIGYLVYHKQDKILLFIVIISFIQTFINDISVFPTFEILNKLTFPFVPIALSFTILGHLLYKYKDYLKTKKYLVLLLPLSIILSIILELLILRIDQSILRFFYWDSFIAFLFVIGLFSFIQLLNDDSINKGRGLISFLASRSFYIYLWHYAIYMFLTSIGLISFIKSLFSFSPLIASLICAIIIYFIGLIISSLIIYLKRLIKKAIKR